MKVRCLGIEQSDLIRYLKKNWRGYNTKDYELLVAWLVAKFYDEQYSRSHFIGIPMKYDLGEVIPDNTEENIERIIHAYLEEDTPIDIFITPKENIKEVISGAKVGKAKGNAFQLKRVRAPEQNDKTDEIINFLTEVIPKKYAQIEAGLILIIDNDNKLGNTSVNLTQIKKNFSPVNYPFDNVLLVAFDPQHTEVTIFAELYPNFGLQKYSFAQELDFL